MTQAHPNAWWMAQLRQAFQEKAVSLSRHEQAKWLLWAGQRGSEMGWLGWAQKLVTSGSLVPVLQCV